MKSLDSGYRKEESCVFQEQKLSGLISSLLYRQDDWGVAFSPNYLSKNNSDSAFGNQINK